MRYKSDIVTVKYNIICKRLRRWSLREMVMRIDIVPYCMFPINQCILNYKSRPTSSHDHTPFQRIVSTLSHTHVLTCINAYPQLVNHVI